MTLSLIGYDPVGVWTKTLTYAAELSTWRNSAGITWIDVEGLDQQEEINRITEMFGIHPLTLEDIFDSTHQRPKVEEFDNYLFIVIKSVNLLDDFNFKHISLVITKDIVLTFHDQTINHFDGIKKRIINNAGRVRHMGADYLAYALIDAVVDGHLIGIDSLSSEIENFEDRALAENDDSFIYDIQEVKQKLLKMRRAVWPLRECLSLLMRLESNFISNDLDPFLKDLYDHVIQATETINTNREFIAGIMEINMTMASNRLNKVIKVLTIISTIFIPLTFIVGVYGMNFQFMPELDYAPAYFIVWGLMLCIALGMLLFFKRRKWI
jgi:magnesium transporter